MLPTLVATGGAYAIAKSMTAALAHLARLAGVVDHWVDAAGYRHASSDAVLREVLSSMGLACSTPAQLLQSTVLIQERRRLAPAMLTAWLGMPTRLGFALPTPAPFRIVYEDGVVVEGQVFDADGGRWLPPVLHAGYHVLDIAGVRIRLAVAPLQACSIADLGPARSRLWGLSIDSHPGLDHAELSVLVRNAAGHGADALAVGDLHAGDVLDADVARIDVGQTFDVATVVALSEDGRAPGLRQLYQDALPRDEALLREFLRFARDGGDALQVGAVHAALRRTHGESRQDWPSAFAVGTGSAVADHARVHAEDVGFELFVQWLAMRSQRAVQASARAAGMAIGLVVDLPWGASPGGTAAWAQPQAYLRGLRVADPWHPGGVDANTSDALGFDPLRLVDHGYRPWLDGLRAAMTGVGAIRLLRVDRWQRAWRQSAVETGAGAYVEQPFDDLLRLLVLESVRQRCVVIVDGVEHMPERWHAVLAQAGLLRADSLVQRDGSQWIVASASPASQVTASSRCDTPDLHAWWQARDIQQRIDEGRVSAAIAVRESRQREQQRTRLVGQLGVERRPSAPAWPDDRRSHPARALPQRATAVVPLRMESLWLDATLTTLGQAPAALVLVAIDDLLGDPVDTVDLDARGGRGLIARLDTTAARKHMARIDEARRGDAAGQPNATMPATDPLASA